MSARMLLLLTFVGCCMAALLDEQDVDTRTVDSLLTYLDHEMTSDLSDDEFMHYIVTNATISNETYHVIEESAGCSEIFDCPRSGVPPSPAGSPQKGYYISAGLLHKQCRYMKELMSCYVQYDYTDCPYVTGMIKQLTPVYRYMCREPGRTEILNFLPCANNYDIQVKMFETYIKFVSAIWTIFNWPDPAEDAYNTMICRAFSEFKSETDESIGEHCSAEDVATFGEFYSAMTSKMLSKHSCDEDHLNH